MPLLLRLRPTPAEVSRRAPGALVVAASVLMTFVSASLVLLVALAIEGATSYCKRIPQPAGPHWSWAGRGVSIDVPWSSQATACTD